MADRSLRLTDPSDSAVPLERVAEVAGRLERELAKAIVGQQRVVREILIAFLAGGHCLLRGVPGLAKTLLIKTLAEAVDLRFNRIQFTPDLMPSDILGAEVIEEDRATGKRVIRFIRGSIVRCSCSRRRIRSSRKARTRCPRRSSIASCSTW